MDEKPGMNLRAIALAAAVSIPLWACICGVMWLLFRYIP